MTIDAITAPDATVGHRREPQRAGVTARRSAEGGPMARRGAPTPPARSDGATQQAQIRLIEAQVPRSGVAAVDRLGARPDLATSDGTTCELSVQGTLALYVDAGSGLPRVPGLTLIHGGRRELDAFASRFAQAVVEVVGGDRSPHQLLRWTTPDVYADLARRAALLQRATPGPRHHRLRAHVRSVHVFCPAPGTAEVSMHVRQGHRSRAVAARLELVQGRWCCAALEFG